MAATATAEGRAKRYGFTDGELDVIPSTALRAGINYDIKYRMGRSSGDDSESA